ncbi:serine/threonine protein phosphatase [Methanobacterium sp. CWC-01]|uniref:metallophosphoesterase n=1 Tax=Methanobacterium aridiramus TaxID=2584467 RepID=UPI0025749810|nr:metallophosphoesterase [Methanobacterium sp. CWC-01]WJI08647.1 serine/threonine protein phosphatase [Methanobacterium sp. CWC-01]
MKYVEGDLVTLPRRGRALVVTDLHGNLEDFNKIMTLWGKCFNRKCHLILTGDFIHAMGRENDHSIDIIEEMQYYSAKYDNFHPLLGNHEWATLTKILIYKGGVNQNLNFEQLLKKTFPDAWEEKLEEYINFFQTLPVAVRTDNQVFISHAGPTSVNSLEDIINLTRNGYLDNQPLYDLLWRREAKKRDVNQFLDKVNCQAMVVGHTPVDGYKLKGNLLILSSSYGKGRKVYLDLDLEQEINSGRDLESMIKFFR